jgi:hypothetical protein
VLSSHAKGSGQDFIPVHIFPAKYYEKKSADYLERVHETDANLKAFENNLRRVYDFFEEKHRLPVIAVSPEGKYVFY